MSNITVKFKDGSVRKFPHEGRAGGSYTKSVQFEGAFVVVVDEWGSCTAFPAAEVAEVHEEQPHGW